MQNQFQITWDAANIATAFGINNMDVCEYLSDGRRASFLLERKLAAMHPGWTVCPKAGSSFDLSAPDGGRWEVRSLTQRMFFVPSSQIGSGRRININKLNAKLAGLDGYIVTDLYNFPVVTVYKIPIDKVTAWYARGVVPKSQRVSRLLFMQKMLPDLAA